MNYQKDFKAVIELDKEHLPDLLIHLNALNDADHCVIDVGADHLSSTFNTLVAYQLFEDIDRVVIPMMPGRTDCENALKTYASIHAYTDQIVFALSRFNPNETLENQYPVFFNNAQKMKVNWKDRYVTIAESDLFFKAQNEKALVVNLAQEVDYKKQALAAKKEDKNEQFHALMKQELNKRAAQILVKECIMPAHERIMQS